MTAMQLDEYYDRLENRHKYARCHILFEDACNRFCKSFKFGNIIHVAYGVNYLNDQIQIEEMIKICISIRLICLDNDENLLESDIINLFNKLTYHIKEYHDIDRDKLLNSLFKEIYEDKSICFTSKEVRSFFCLVRR